MGVELYYYACANVKISDEMQGGVAKRVYLFSSAFIRKAGIIHRKVKRHRMIDFVHRSGKREKFVQQF